jgi:hypothetical protein
VKVKSITITVLEIMLVMTSIINAASADIIEGSRTYTAKDYLGNDLFTYQVSVYIETEQGMKWVANKYYDVKYRFELLWYNKDIFPNGVWIKFYDLYISSDRGELTTTYDGSIVGVGELALPFYVPRSSEISFKVQCPSGYEYPFSLSIKPMYDSEQWNYATPEPVFFQILEQSQNVTTINLSVVSEQPVDYSQLVTFVIGGFTLAIVIVLVIHFAKRKSKR